jgi:choline kinase
MVNSWGVMLNKKDIVVVILAAGRGRRLKPLTNNTPKPLIKLNGKTIIEHQIDCCRRLGLKNIVIVVGYQKNKIKKIVGNSVKYVVNKEYINSKPGYSMWLAGSHLKNKSLLHILGDTYFDFELLKKLVNSKYSNALLVDFDTKLNKEAAKVYIKNGLVKKINKSIPLNKASGECIGLRKFSKECTKELFKRLDESVKNNRKNVFMHSKVSQIANKFPIHPISTKGYKCIEIDTIEDYEDAKKIFHNR